MEGGNENLTDAVRFRPRVAETSRIRVTRFTGLCKSCGECIMKCPVNAISWHDKELGQLGEPAIFIDLDKCIGCETCERVCPDHAIEITNKRLSSAKWQHGARGFIVKWNARLIEYGVYFVRASADRLKKIGKTPEKTLACLLFRFFLHYPQEKIVEYDVVEGEK